VTSEVAYSKSKHIHICCNSIIVDNNTLLLPSSEVFCGSTSLDLVSRGREGESSSSGISLSTSTPVCLEYHDRE
jgi:hypothetical protein